MAKKEVSESKAKASREKKTVSEQKSEGNETYQVKGEQLLGKVKEIIREGNARRIIIKDKEGQILVEFPMTIGVVGTLFAPVWAAVGAIAALVTECSITVERRS